MMPPLRSVRRQRRVVLEQRPHLRVGREHVLERAREDADHGVTVAIEHDLAADHRPIAAEAPLPQPIGDDRQPCAPRMVLERSEWRAERGRHAQHVEVARADALPLESLRLESARERRLPRPRHGERLERAAARENLPEGSERRGEPRAIPAVIPHRDEPPGARVRKGLEEDRMHGAEDRRARPDAEREGEDGGRREARISSQLPGAEPHVAPEGVERVLPAGVAHVLPDGERVSHLEPREPASLVDGMPRSLEFGDSPLAIVRNLVVEVGPRPFAPDEHGESAGELPPERHVRTRRRAGVPRPRRGASSLRSRRGADVAPCA